MIKRIRRGYGFLTNDKRISREKVLEFINDWSGLVNPQDIVFKNYIIDKKSFKDFEEFVWNCLAMAWEDGLSGKELLRRAEGYYENEELELKYTN